MFKHLTLFTLLLGVMSANSFFEGVLSYEEKIFREYIFKRKQLIENIKQFQLKDLTNKQLLTFTNDIKMIIDPIKNTINNIDHHLSNVSLTNEESTNYDKDIQQMVILYNFFLRDFLTRGSDSSELSD
jgi:hypothetical protein